MHVALKVVCVLAVVILCCVCYIVVYHCYPTPKIKNLQSVESIIPYLESGDLVLVSTLYDAHDLDPFFYRLRQNSWCSLTRFVAGKREWTHVALIVKIDNQPYVYDTCTWDPPYTKYDFTYNPRKESGFQHLSKYVENLNGYVGIRKLKQPHTLRRHAIPYITHHHNQHMTFDMSLSRMIKSIFVKSHIKTLQYAYACSEGAASIYNDAGITHEKFLVGVRFDPFVEESSPLFEDVIHIKPGPKCNQNILKYFDHYENNMQQNQL